MYIVIILTNDAGYLTISELCECITSLLLEFITKLAYFGDVMKSQRVAAKTCNGIIAIIKKDAKNLKILNKFITILKKLLYTVNDY